MTGRLLDVLFGYCVWVLNSRLQLPFDLIGLALRRILVTLSRMAFDIFCVGVELVSLMGCKVGLW